jgi:hypothetical protein
MSLGTLNTWNTWVEIVQGVVTILAIPIGGYWAYSRFVKRRQGWPSASTEHAVQVEQLSSSEKLVRLCVRIRNSGHVLLKCSKVTVWIQQVAPCSPENLEWIRGCLASSADGGTEAPWPMMMEEVSASLQQEIEPGESDETYFDFMVPVGVRSIQIYSHIPNETKTGIEWNHTTMHDVEHFTGAQPMEKKQGPPKAQPATPSLPSTPAQPVPGPSDPRPTPQGPPKQPPPPPPKPIKSG